MNHILESQQTPYISPSRASYRVSIVRILVKIDHVLTAPHCIQGNLDRYLPWQVPFSSLVPLAHSRHVPSGLHCTQFSTAHSVNIAFHYLSKEGNKPSIGPSHKCIRQISHNTLFCNRNVNICAHFCYKTLRVGYGTGALCDLCSRSFQICHLGLLLLTLINSLAPGRFQYNFR